MKTIKVTREIKVDEVAVFLSENGIKDLTDIIVKKPFFEELVDAEEYLEDIGSDDSKMYAVRTQVTTGVFDDTEKAENIKEELEKYKTQIDGFPSDLVEKLKEQTSSKRTCKHCKSSISKEFFVAKIEEKEGEPTDEDINCPICDDSDFLRSTTDSKKLKGWEEKYKIWEEKYQTEKILFEKNPNNTQYCILIKEPTIGENILPIDEVLAQDLEEKASSDEGIEDNEEEVHTEVSPQEKEVPTTENEQTTPNGLAPAESGSSK